MGRQSVLGQAAGPPDKPSQGEGYAAADTEQGHPGHEKPEAFSHLVGSNAHCLPRAISVIPVLRPQTACFSPIRGRYGSLPRLATLCIIPEAEPRLEPLNEADFLTPSDLAQLEREVEGARGGAMAGRQEFVEITRVHGELEASIVKSHLESEGIPVLLKYESAGRVFGLTVNGLGEVRVLVPQDLAEEAKRIIEPRDEVEGEE